MSVPDVNRTFSHRRLQPIRLTSGTPDKRETTLVFVQFHSLKRSSLSRWNRRVHALSFRPDTGAEVPSFCRPGPSEWSLCTSGIKVFHLFPPVPMASFAGAIITVGDLELVLSLGDGGGGI